MTIDLIDTLRDLQQRTLPGHVTHFDRSAALGIGAIAEPVDHAHVSGTATLDVTAANVFDWLVTGETTIRFDPNSDNPDPTPEFSGRSCTLIIEQDAIGGHSISWPEAVEWADGTSPQLATDGGARHLLSFISTDAGESWIGLVSAEDLG